MTSGGVLEQLVDAAWALHERAAAAAPAIVVQPSMPVLYFGDLDAYRRSPVHVVTAALNPSTREFPTADPWQRFPAGKALRRPLDDHARGTYLSALSGYFRTSPYSAWFDGSFERVLWGLDASYYEGRANVALHTDIASPVPTDPTWGKLSPGQRSTVRDESAAIWLALIAALQPDVVIVSTAREYVDAVVGIPLERWQAVETLAHARPFVVRAIRTVLGGHETLVVFAPAAQVPFGTASYDERERIGRRIAAVSRGEAPQPTTLPGRARATRPGRRTAPAAGAPFSSFDGFVRGVVLPLQAEHPGWRRLDGEATGGNRSVAGSFRHGDDVWKVHADTHFAPLLLAHRALAAGGDPFVVEHARAGRCLALREDLRRQYASPHKHLYIYEL
jgi:hypothetical protein